MTITYTLTLSRWHKVAERLSREYTETVENVTEALTRTRILTYVGEGQEQDLLREAEECNARLARAFRLQDSVTAVRRALGNENARVGVTAQLAEMEKLNRRTRVLTKIVEGQSRDMIGIAELRNIPSEYVASEGSYFDRGMKPLPVRMMEPDSIARMQKDLVDIRARAYTLSDAIAELNQSKLSLELSKEVALAAGLPT